MNSFIVAAIFLVIVIIQRSSCTIVCLLRTRCISEIKFSNTAGDGGPLQTLSGDLQLLIPAWRFSSSGHVSMWEAMVQGSAASNSIEFQIFRPAENAAGVYNLVYGNRFNANGGSQSENSASLIVRNGCNPPEIPVRPGDVVGIRLKNNIPSFGLQYSSSTSGAGVDVYYWQQGMDSQACNLSICDSNAVVLRGIIPLVSWRFCPTLPPGSPITLITNARIAAENIFQQLMQQGHIEPLNCARSSPPSCPLEPSQTILTIPNEPQSSDPSALTTSQMSLVEVPSPTTAVQNAKTLLLSNIELIASSTPQVTTTFIDTVINTSTIVTEAMIPTLLPFTTISALTSPNTEATESSAMVSATMSTPLPTTAITSTNNYLLSSSPNVITTNNLVVSTTLNSDASSTPIQTVKALMPIYLIIIISLAVMCVVFFIVAILTVFIVLCMKLKKKEKRVKCDSTEISPQFQGRLQVSAADSESAHTSLPGIAYDYSSIYESLRSDQVAHAAATHIVVMNENSAYGVMDQDNKVISTYVNVAYNVPQHESQIYY